MGNARRNWHRAWSIDLARQTATHNSGMVVQFVDRLVFPRPEIGTHCSVEGVGEWTGFMIGGDDALISWLGQNPNLSDPASIRTRIVRLMEEAGRAWAMEKKDAHEN